MEKQVQELCRQLHLDKWYPDYIVGLTRGGLVPATMISQYLGCAMHTLKVSLRDSSEQESNLWMAEDAFNGKQILIVDDINDSGATLNWIQQDWQSSCLPNDPHWTETWGHSVRTAVLCDNLASQYVGKVNYAAMEINKLEQDVWVDFPWESWWKR